MKKLIEVKAILIAAAFGIGIIATNALAQQIQLKPGRTKDGYQNTHVRDEAYCEIIPVLGKEPNLVAQYYNTLGPDDYCPADKWLALDSKKLAEELGASFIYLDPTPQTARRHAVMDELWVFAAGESVDFHGVKGTWGAAMWPAQVKEMLGKDFEPRMIHRGTKYLWNKGSKVFLMRTPGGKAWVMLSYTTEVDKDLTFDTLPQIGSQLNLPAGYSFEVKTLDKDLIIDPRNSDGIAYITRDNLHNVYEVCGFDAACNYTP